MEIVNIFVTTWGGKILLKKNFIKKVKKEKVEDRNKMDRLCLKCVADLVIENEETIFQSLPSNTREQYRMFPEAWDEFLEMIIDDAEWSWERV